MFQCLLSSPGSVSRKCSGATRWLSWGDCRTCRPQSIKICVLSSPALYLHEAMNFAPFLTWYTLVIPERKLLTNPVL